MGTGFVYHPANLCRTEILTGDYYTTGTRLRILVYGMNFLPEETGVGKYTGEMVQWLAANGADVTVITAPPYYPEWRVRNGYRRFWYAKDHAFPGICVIRCPIWVPTSPGALSRTLHLLCFAATSGPVALRYGLLRRFDLLWTVEPTLATAPIALLAAWLAKARSWLHVQDLEVDAAFALGIAKGGLLKRLIGRVETGLTRGFDRVSTISNAMRSRILDKGVAAQKLTMFRNWANIDEIQPLQQHPPLRTELGIPDDAIVALYSGNMGAKQGLSMLADAARMLADEPRIFFLLCGDGLGRAALEESVSGLANVRLLQLQPKSRLNELLNSADIHLLPQRDSVAQLVLPSKLTGMLASGRPVVAGCGEDTELAATVSRCGIAVPAGAAEPFADAIRSLAADPVRRKELGRAARLIAEQEMSRECILQAFFDEAVYLIDKPE